MKKEHVITEALPIYRKLASDDQDSVRLLTIHDLVAIAQQLTPPEVKDHLLTQIRQSLTDKSWRVRYMVSSNFVDVSLKYVCAGIGLITIVAR
jgi:serine/threonine-protein phosphatase 2A regulatory subunit A